jgi:hypothetical protein
MLEEQGAPSEVSHLGLILEEGSFVMTGENSTVIGIRGKGLDVIASLAPSLVGLVRMIDSSVPPIDALPYSGETIYSSEGVAYHVHDAKVYLGEIKSLKQVILAYQKNENALKEFEGVINKLEKNDFLMATKIPSSSMEGLFLKKIGASGKLKEETTEIRVVIETGSASMAPLFSSQINQIEFQGVDFELVGTEEEFIELRLEGSLEAIMNAMQGGIMPSDEPEENGSDDENITPPITIGNNSIQQAEEYCEQNPEECEKILEEIGLPCSTPEECEEYCTQNPLECMQKLEELEDSFPIPSETGDCCQECLTVFASEGYGLEDASMQCSDLPLSEDCQQEFQENPEQVAQCYQ